MKLTLKELKVGNVYNLITNKNVQFGRQIYRGLSGMDDRYCFYCACCNELIYIDQYGNITQNSFKGHKIKYIEPYEPMEWQAEAIGYRRAYEVLDSAILEFCQLNDNIVLKGKMQSSRDYARSFIDMFESKKIIDWQARCEKAERALRVAIQTLKKSKNCFARELIHKKIETALAEINKILRTEEGLK